MPFNFVSQRGFTLVEVLTVMLVLVAIASITVESTKDFVFQGRYDITKDRYEKIKKAIIGDPNQVINGQPNIEGFVKDVGRLPDNIRELFQTGYCRSTVGGNFISTKRRFYMCGQLANQDEWIWVNVPCTNDSPSNSNKTSCENAGGTWLGQDISNGLYYGWHGSYLNTSNDVTKQSAFSDGWGTSVTLNNPSYHWNGNQDDINYGWYTEHKDNAANSINPTPSTEAISLGIQSRGKNGNINPADTGYDEDYPKSTALPAIKQNDWMVDINNIQVSINTPFNFNQCDITQLATQSACEAAGQTWQTGRMYCQDTSKTDSATCTGGTLQWNSTFGACTDTAKTTSTTCTGGTLQWVSPCTTLNSTVCNVLNWAAWDTNKCLSKSKAFCDKYISPTTFKSPNVCLRVTYRSIDKTNGQTVIQYISSSPQSIQEDGREQLITFSNLYYDANANGIKDTGENMIPLGKASIGIYTDCNFATKYNDPFVNRSEIQVTFFPNTTLPTINW